MIYSVLDVETTGLSPGRGDRVLEIGIVRLREDGGIEAVLDTLVNPDRPVAATRIHGISDAMVADAPVFRDILPLVDELLDGTVVSAHNAPFDLSFLREEYRRGGVRFPNLKPACTLTLARRYLSHLPSRSLEACRRHLNLSDDGAHNALADARAAAEVLRYFLNSHEASPEAVPYRAVGTSAGEPSLFDEKPKLKPRSRHNGD